MTPDLFRQLVADASLAPSVHNVQPARWRLDGATIQLFEDRSVRLPAGDPTGHDAAISLGAAIEGMSLAAGKNGVALTAADQTIADLGDLRFVASFTLTEGATADPLSQHVTTRQSWRGIFADQAPQDEQAALGLIADDCAVVADRERINDLADVIDRASFGFMAQPDFRAELVSWMRLRRSHPKWTRDGLNADAMGLGSIERAGASMIMGRLFGPLKAVGLAAPLLAEAAKTKSATAIVLFHRPQDEAPMISGRAFYRAWLAMEAAGFGAAVLAALADDPQAAKRAADLAGIPADRRLVSAFRIGRRPTGATYTRARQPIDAIIV